ncbi:hypothetical protein AMTRI_Chr02g265970 [Amborella trichopoda]
MIGSLTQNTHLYISPETPNSVSGLKSKDQECFTLLQKSKNMKEFMQVHAKIIKLGFTHDSQRAGDAMAMCALSHWGSMDYACSIFHQIQEPNTFIFNTMIRGHVGENEPGKAFSLYVQMLLEEVLPNGYTFPFVIKACAQLSALEKGHQLHGMAIKFGFGFDTCVMNTLISMYAKCGDISSAKLVFDSIPQKNPVSWSAMISGYTKCGLWDQCLSTFSLMQSEGWRPDESTLVSVLSSCAHLSALDLGRCTHASLLRKFSNFNVVAETSLIEMYVKCGCIERGMTVFERMLNNKNMISYGVMISGLAAHGYGKKALELLSELMSEGWEPDDAIYVGVLRACSHAGLVKEGHRLFEKTISELQIQPTIQLYGCMVDLLGRSGSLKEAYELVRNMPIKPNEVIWRTLLSACKVHHNIEIGEIASEKLIELDSFTAGDYMLASNIYARGRRWGNVERLRTEMADNGLVQSLGHSSIEVERKVHRFVSQDRAHPQSNEIYEMIHQIAWQLRFEGYSLDTSEVLTYVSEEEKRDLVLGHSQKLAITFGLISTAPGSILRISRNLRMCSDCHATTRLISKIFRREIIVRERNRFHHFKGGECSCGDYW